MIVAETFAEVYRELAWQLMHNGKEAKPRGMKTKELLGQQFCITNPEMNLALIPGRKFSLMHAIAESLLLFIPCNDLSAYTLMNEGMSRYSDDGKTLYGAYGYRVACHITDVINKLRKDPDSRQAVLTINKVDDNFTQTKDVPCTIALQFLIREGKLDCFAYMRSNDIIWGTPYDVFVFTTAQMVIANTLKIPVGRYYHTATSLHVYENMYDVCDSIVKNGGEAIGHYNKNAYFSWMQMADEYAKFAKTKEELHAFNIFSYDDDGTYSAAILAELNYKGMFGEDKHPMQVLDDLSYDGINDWVKAFSKRWEKCQ